MLNSKINVLSLQLSYNSFIPSQFVLINTSHLKKYLKTVENPKC
jgi:hypothetical protein